jgi:hypothetical protein
MQPPTVSPEPAFQLRCRDGEWIDRDETLAEFAKPAAPTPMQQYAGLAEVLVADEIARAHFEIEALAEQRVILTCETARFGIPLGVFDLEQPPIDDWRIRAHLDADWIDTDRHGRIERSLAMQVRRGLIAVAGALPLLLGPMAAHAGDPPSPNVELAAFGPPKLPDKTEPAPTPPATPEPAAMPVVEPPPQPQPPPAPRMSNESLSMTGTTLWEGLMGQQVKLDMKNGQSVAGTVVAQTASELALARAADGTVVAVPKAEVLSVRMRVDASAAGAPGSASKVPLEDRPTQDGRGLEAGGIVMVTLGSIAALSGTVFLGITPSYVFISLPLLLPGLAMIGGGSAMIAAGGKKKKAFNKAWGIPLRAGVQLTPTLTGGRNGGSAGLVLRF